MKFNNTTFIIIFFIFSSALAYSQGTPNEFQGRVIKDGNFLVIEVSHIGMASTRPMMGNQLTDLTLSLLFPTSVNMSMSSVTPSAANVQFSGGITPLNGTLSYQQFSLQSLSTLSQNWITGVYYEMFRVSYSAPGATSTDEASLALYGVVSQFEPVIEFNASGNYFDLPGVQAALLPININSFDVTKNSDRSSKLDWTTSSETNSDYFGIERSQDGNNWEVIGIIKAAGNSSKTLAYSFIDDRLPLNRNNENVFYYRLKMSDLDGKYKYSDIRGINFRHSFSGFVTIYPNPTTDRINVDLSGLDLLDGKVDLSVYDMNGGRLINKNIIGNGIELIDVNNLPAATYNVVVKQGTNVYQQRIIKID